MRGFEYFLHNYERKLDDLELVVYAAIRSKVPIKEIAKQLNRREEDIIDVIEGLVEKGYLKRSIYSRL